MAISTLRWDVDEINVLGVMHHAHLVGKRLKVEVTRNGEYIGVSLCASSMCSM